MQATESNSIKRRHFLRGRFRGEAKAIRPPWALMENDFINACSRCNECIKQCPEKIIVKDEGGFPVVNFDFGACTFCQDCVAACDDDALVISAPEQAPWNLIAHISNACISLHAVSCRSCADSCEEEAISFHHQLGGVSQPSINKESCTGCGACLATCPVDAIKISENRACEEYAYDHN